MASIVSAVLLYLTAVVQCKNDEEVIKISLRSILERTIADEQGMLLEKNTTFLAPLILGITPHCLVYFGWLQQIMAGYAYGTYTLPKKKYFCGNYLPIVMKTENTNEDLYLGIRRFGRRILIQNLFGEMHYAKAASVEDAKQKTARTKTVQNPVLWSSIDPTARQYQFLSNEFERGFQFRGCFIFRGRVILYGEDDTNIIFYELKVTQTAFDEERGLGNLLLPTVKKFANLSRNIFPPAHVRVQVTSDSFTARELNEVHKVQIGLYPQSDDNHIMRGAIEIPLITLMRGQTHEIKYRQDIQAVAYKCQYEDNESVTIYESDYTREKIGNFILLEKGECHQNDSLVVRRLPNVRIFILASSRVWMNPYRFSRRMTYPNAVHTMSVHHILRGWKRFIPLLVANLAIFTVLMYIVSLAMKYHRKMMMKLGAYSSSQTANTL
ncbi:unnamed protein product [Cylicocyclus nassatus]|uniref:Uncharacterized protein n=1 Tax=Cylicocyclus nassatus TaxID=53992 RepID=A0AA36GVR3_CYLNA|nr:unnamed protein product [Cylicocyclus nassatus]